MSMGMGTIVFGGMFVFLLLWLVADFVFGGKEER
jgi:hypothetical protein